MELSGKIVKVLQLQSGQGKNGVWKKQEFVLEYGDSYPKLLCFNLWGDKVDQFALSEGDAVTVSFDVESREYNGRWYTTIRAWKIDKNGSGNAPVAVNSAATAPFEVAPAASEGSDLPF